MRKLLIPLGVICAISFTFRDKKVHNVDDMMTEAQVIYPFSITFENTFREENSAYGVYHENEIKSLEQLDEITNTVVSVQPISRKQYGAIVFLECQITDVYVSSIELKELDIIYIIDRTRMWSDGISLGSPLLPMEKNQEYIAFLNYIEGYDDPHFSFSSLTFSIFPKKEEVQALILVDFQEGGVNKESIQGYDLLYIENPRGDEYYQNYIRYYKEVHAEVMKKYR